MKHSNVFAQILSRFSLELRYVRRKLGRDSRPSWVMSYRIVRQSRQVKKIEPREEREPRMMRLMGHSLIHIGLITTMALAIVPSSRITRIGWCGNTIVWWTLTSRNYKAVIRRVSRLLIPAPIR